MKQALFVSLLLFGFVLVSAGSIFLFADKVAFKDIRSGYAYCVKQTQRTAFIACMKDRFRRGIYFLGPLPYMKGLDKMGSVMHEGINRCHDVAHAIGQLGVRKALDVSFCSSSLCGDGCYHGAMEGIVLQGQTLEESLTRLCSSLNQNQKRSVWACFHGMGHGIASVTADVAKGLALCDRIENEEGKVNCANGIFMELYLSPSIDHAKLPVPRNPVAFCQSVGSVFASACFSTVGVWVLEDSGSIEAASAVCASVPDNERESCFMALGGRIYNMSAQSPEGILRLCELLESGSASCIRGSIQESVFSDQDASVGIQLCKQEADAAECFGFLGAKIEEGYGKEKRMIVCSELSEKEKSACLSYSL